MWAVYGAVRCENTYADFMKAEILCSQKYEDILVSRLRIRKETVQHEALCMRQQKLIHDSRLPLRDTHA